MVVHIFPADFVPLPVYFLTLCTWHCQEDILRPQGLGTMSQLLFVLEGEGTLRCEGGEYPLRRGCAFYIDEKLPHGYSGNGKLITAWIGFRGDGCAALQRYIRGASLLFLENVDVEAYTARLAKMEREYYEGKREGVLSAMLYSLLISFFDEQKKSALTDMDRVLGLMEERYRERLTVSQLAAAAHISKSTFCKRFKEKFGCTAFQKLMDIRLINAEHLLRLKPHEKLRIIARECGFDDVGYFCKAYKQKYGKTPRGN